MGDPTFYQAFIAETVGTCILMLFGNGVCANVTLKKTYGSGSDWMVITTGWAFAVAIGAYTVNGITGAHLNPAVSIGMAVIGKLSTNLLAPYILG